MQIPRALTSAATLLSVALVVTLGTATARAFPVPADEGQAVSDLAARLGVTDEVVYDDMRVMDDAGTLSDRLVHYKAADFGGAWFDNRRARFEVAVAAASEGKAAESGTASELIPMFRERGLADRVDFVPVSDTLNALENSAAALELTLRNEVEAHKVHVSVSAPDNTVTLSVTAKLDQDERAAVDDAATSADGVKVRVVQADPATLIGATNSCIFPNCDRPLHGGVELLDRRTGVANTCSAGAEINVDGSVFLATAGHCIGTTFWAIHASTGSYQQVGSPWAGTFGANGDWKLIYVPYNTFWTGVTWLPMTVTWGGNHDTPVHAVSSALFGSVVCKVGYATGGSCGTVTNTSPPPPTLGGTVVGNLVQTSMCPSDFGDSGGTVTLGYGGTTILGMLSGSNCSGGNNVVWIMPFDRMMDQVRPGHWAAYVVTQ